MKCFPLPVRPLFAVVALLALVASCQSKTPPLAEATAAKPAPVVVDEAIQAAPEARAKALAKRVIIVDGHIDVPWRLHQGKDEQGNLTEDVTKRTDKGDFDFVRAREGGLDAPFMSIYVPSSYEDKGGAKQLADHLIDLVEQLVAASDGQAAIARSPADVRRLFSEKKLALPLGMENGSPLEGKLENLRHFYDRGVRYVTLAHAKDNHLADASYDTRHTNKGLSPFGREVIAEMNRLGMFVDVAHLSDDAVKQAVELSSAPVIASHSSCRHFTPGFERNLSDDLIRLIAAKGGVVMVNFGSSFLDDEARKSWDRAREKLNAALEKEGITRDHPTAPAFIEKFYAVNKGSWADVTKVADHIDHIVKLVGVEHVGLGSDFDGVGDSLPTGLKDVSQYPNLFRVLLERGHSEADIAKIAGRNALLAWEEVERVAKATAAP